MNYKLLVILVAAFYALTAAVTTQAHGDEDHGAKPPVITTTNTPQRLPDGGLFVPKAVQRELGLRTVMADVKDIAVTIELNGTVIADPSASGRVQASQAGRIASGPTGMPTLGQRVTQGQVLAYLQPLANNIERGNQQAQLADLEAQFAIAERKAQRLAQLEGAVPRKDIDAARLERDALQQRRTAVNASLNTAEVLRAPRAGVISTALVSVGQVVEAKDVVFEVVDPTRLAVEALAYDTTLSTAVTSANAVLRDGRGLALSFIGASQQLREQAVPLLFRVQSAGVALAVGQPLKVIAHTSRTLPGVAVPLAAVVRNGADETVVWVHTEAERFQPRRVRFQSLDANTVVITTGVKSGERVVSVGASLLAQIR